MDERHAGIINLHYKNPNFTQIAEEQLSKEGVVQLQSIFDLKFYDTLLEHLKSLHYEKDIDLMTHKYKISKISSEFEHVLNKDFSELLSKIFRSKIRNINFKAVFLEWKDYTLMHDKNKRHKEIIIEFEEWDENFGGNIIYSDNNGEYVTIPPKWNSLIISNGSMQRFIKYINHHAKSKRYILIGEIQ